MAEVARSRESEERATVANEMRLLREREPDFAAFVDDFRAVFGARVTFVQDRVTGKTFGRRVYTREHVAQSGKRPRKAKRA